MADLVTLETVDGVATLTLHRPEVRNAISPELLAAAHDHLATVEADISVRVLVMAGADPCFCSGMDLKGVMRDPPALAGLLQQFATFLGGIRRLPVPVIARVQGAAVGGGCGLMVACDFAVTHPESKVGYPEVTLGVSPAVVAPWLMRRIGPGATRALLLSGGTMSGAEGHARGLVTHLAPREALDGAVADLAACLAGGTPEALATTKRWLNELEGSAEDDLHLRGAAISAEVVAGDAAQRRLASLFDD